MLKSFYLRDATLFLPLWPSVSVRLSVRQSQADILSKKRTDRARALYRGTLGSSYIAVEWNSGISKNIATCTSLWNFLSNSGLRNGNILSALGSERYKLCVRIQINLYAAKWRYHRMLKLKTRHFGFSLLRVII